VINVTIDTELMPDVEALLGSSEMVGYFSEAYGIPFALNAERVKAMFNVGVLVMATIRETVTGDSPADPQDRPAGSTKTVVVGVCLVVLDQEYIFCKGAKAAHLSFTYLRPEYRGKRLVYFMYDHLFAWLKGQKYDYVSAQYMVGVDMAKVINHYGMRINEYACGGVLWG
jgi:hypothetical protein